MLEERQVSLWCRCGREQVTRNGLCRSCNRRLRLSLEKFGGFREKVFARDCRAQCCGQIDDLLVHHRRQGANRLSWLILLCRGCHTRVHHTQRPGYAFPEALRTLWREQHRGWAEQLLLPLASGKGRRVNEPVQPALFDVAA